ncbi:hypothetical protein O181_056591 [Austropuccinia psidii MF-1]|uniref:CCHC-type domain-containing protein n=1 Tax=Austropuccinia psidii MF-1 TaxID=1389203 RepID=A0A9Q3EDJ1_9BASI|nr:hypothetical protein [Austropuccinia psidii MF-1]
MSHKYQTTGSPQTSTLHSEVMQNMVHLNERDKWQGKLAMVEKPNNKKLQKWYLDFSESISFENGRYFTEKDPYAWCLRKTKRLKSIDPKKTIGMRNHKLLKKRPGDLGQKMKFRCREISSSDDIANVIQDFRKKTTIGSSSPYRSHDSIGKQKLLMEKDIKPINCSEEPKRISICYNCGSPYHYANDCPKGKKIIFSIKKELVEGHIKYKSDSHSMVNGLGEDLDSELDPIEQYLLDYEDNKKE